LGTSVLQTAHKRNKKKKRKKLGSGERETIGIDVGLTQKVPLLDLRSSFPVKREKKKREKRESEQTNEEVQTAPPFFSKTKKTRQRKTREKVNSRLSRAALF
jgi:hypothetical protein